MAKHLKRQLRILRSFGVFAPQDDGSRNDKHSRQSPSSPRSTVVIWTLGEMISSPMASAYVAQLAPAKYRGRYMGLLVVAWSFGMLTSPPLGTLLFAHNEMILWAACGILGIVGAALMLTQSRLQTITS